MNQDNPNQNPIGPSVVKEDNKPILTEEQKCIEKCKNTKKPFWKFWGGKKHRSKKNKNSKRKTIKSKSKKSRKSKK